ncbi:hypothetical protein PV325_004908 [Microctonus aethiopoides]|uniref:CBF1-interacting co-repressor CIR N-terminal domain-containing protein n=1 Tax=Microctonus aethiopoides TaxID=144406 RepID=A0AA39CAS2_9HYME|nr:hypothetical protein PV325_004908 [Microctonus aethiopoides]KAK0098998.1 hypothetical protein PV326_010974 [Microctonus aethiopoides]KAK0160953.1 hypothetical protein PV328_008301 [Microctonus aethiopoides]
MGKGFNNYMCKKFFHPASRDNLKRVWMAEQQADAYKKKQEELRVQYEKEQDLHNNKAILSKESKDKLSVNFMYEAPPGAKKEREKEDNEPEYKFEWQRKYNAPRESYCKGDSEIRDQPFGIQVRNVRCIKCHKWGHINTDKECPLYSQAMSVVVSSQGPVQESSDALMLVQQMRDEGLALKKSALSAQQHLRVPEHEDEMVSGDDEMSEEAFLNSLSKKEKKRLLKKLEKMEKKKAKKDAKKRKNKKDKKKKSRKHNSSSSSSDSSNFSSSDSNDSMTSSSEDEKHRERKKKSKRQHNSNSNSEREEKIKSKDKQRFENGRSELDERKGNVDHKNRHHRNCDRQFFRDKKENHRDRNRDDRKRKRNELDNERRHQRDVKQRRD